MDLSSFKEILESSIGDDYFSQFKESSAEVLQKTKFWNDWLYEHSEYQQEPDNTVEYDSSYDKYIGHTLYEVVSLAIDNNQHLTPAHEDDCVPRVIRVSLGMSREMIERVFNVRTYSIYMTGLFILADGFIISQKTRKASGYDSKDVRQGINISVFPTRVQEEGDLRLMVPANDGLFIPKKCELLNQAHWSTQIQYLTLDDLALNY